MDKSNKQIEEEEEIKQFIPCYLNLSTRKDPEWICSKNLLGFIESMQWLNEKREHNTFLPKHAQDKEYIKIRDDLWNQKILNFGPVSQNLFLKRESYFLEIVRKKYIQTLINTETKFE